MRTWTTNNQENELIVLGNEKVFKGTIVQRDHTEKLLDADYEKLDELNSLPYSYMFKLFLRNNKNRIDISYSRNGSFSLYVDDENQRNEIYNELIAKFPKAKVFDREYTMSEKGAKPLIALMVILIFFVTTLSMKLSNQQLGASSGEKENILYLVLNGIASINTFTYTVLFALLFTFSISIYIIKVNRKLHRKEIFIRKYPPFNIRNYKR